MSASRIRTFRCHQSHHHPMMMRLPSQHRRSSTAPTARRRGALRQPIPGVPVKALHTGHRTMGSPHMGTGSVLRHPQADPGLTGAPTAARGACPGSAGAALCRGAKLTLSTTTAALYRRIEAAEDKPPTVLQDEADAIFGRTTTPQAEDLRALFNSGYKRGARPWTAARATRSNMKGSRVQGVRTGGAGQGSLRGCPATITSRGFTMHMRRRAPG